jgi:NAD(P)-dependent dehydrogenase (short-subunit alcohol dehydrogenase family)
LRFDVTKLDEAIAVADRVESELGPIDILVNNAGWDVVLPFVESTPDLWDKVIAINFRGMLNWCKAVAPRMQSRGAGKIVSISSDAGRVGSSGGAVYAGCKAAIIGFSKTLARELAANHINVNVVRDQPTPLCSGTRWRGTRKFSNRWRVASRFAASGNRRTWPARSHSSLLPIPTSSPARCSASAAA